MSRRGAGQLWETRAGDFLRRQGLEILRERYHCRFGELDLICIDGEALTIVEVRARKGDSVVRALETIDAAKRRKLIRATRHLLMQHPEWGELPLRFDVVAIDDIDSPDPRFIWIKNAFDADHT